MESLICTKVRLSIHTYVNALFHRYQNFWNITRISQYYFQENNVLLEKTGHLSSYGGYTVISFLRVFRGALPLRVSILSLHFAADLIMNE